MASESCSSLCHPCHPSGWSLECGMPTCKRSIVPKTCILREATWKHDSNSNPCPHWVCWPRFPLAPRAPLAPPLLLIVSIMLQQLIASLIRHPHHCASTRAPPDCTDVWCYDALLLGWFPAAWLVWCPAYVLLTSNGKLAVADQAGWS